jgi:hypothetical protein
MLNPEPAPMDGRPAPRSRVGGGMNPAAESDNANDPKGVMPNMSASLSGSDKSPHNSVADESGGVPGCMWDARWTPAQQDEAVALADDAVRKAKRHVEDAHRLMDNALGHYLRATSSALTVREANDELIEQWPHGIKGSPVWHMHEPIDRLKALAEDWPRICIGSSGAYRIVGSPTWTRRMEAAMDALCSNGPVPVWLHMLRGLDYCGSDFPFASADSTNVARNHAGTNSGRRRRDANTMAAEIDARQCPARWRGAAPLPVSLLEVAS